MPAMAEPKTHRLNLRISAHEDMVLRKAAAEAGESLSEFVVSTARLRAEMLLADRTHFKLSDENWEAFNAWLDRPARVIPGLVDLFHRQLPE